MQSKLKQTLASLVLDECERNAIVDISQSSSQDSSSSCFVTSSDSLTNSKRRKLFQYDENDGPSALSGIVNVNDELNRYLSESNKTNSLSVWKNNASVSLLRVIQRVFSVQASSAPVERAFSQSGLIMSPRRTSMGDELFQSLVFLRVNQHLL